MSDSTLSDLLQGIVHRNGQILTTQKLPDASNLTTQTVSVDTTIVQSSTVVALGTEFVLNSLSGKNTFPLISTKSPSDFFYTLTSFSSNTSEGLDIIKAARETLSQMIVVTSNIYRDVLAKCEDIIDNADIEDSETRDQTVARLIDTLEPFSSVIEAIFRGLLAPRSDQPDTVSFLLNYVLLGMDKVGDNAKIVVIQNAWSGARPSIRFAAMQALDNIGVSRAKQLMASAYTMEANKMIRDLIQTSIQEV